MTETLRTFIDTYAEHWRTGRSALNLARYHDDFVLHYAGAHRLSGTFRGKAVALVAMRSFGEATGRKLVEIVETMAGETYASIIAREQFHAAPGAPILRRVAVYRVVDDWLHECWVYDDDQAIVDRLIG